MPSFSNEAVLKIVPTIVFIGLAIYFSVLIAKSLSGYMLFRRLRPTALATWRMPRPDNLSLLFALGILAAVVTILNAAMQKPFHHVYGQGVMALYFILMAPLAARIPVGFYRDGVWAVKTAGGDTGFLRWSDIGRLAFREGPEIVLILLPRDHSRPLSLTVPPEEYGIARKVLEEKIRAHVLNVEKGILGL